MWYLAALVLYSIGAWAVYSPLRDTWWIFPVNLSVVMLGSIAWILLARSCNGPAEILTAGLIWDLIVGICYLIPFIVSESRGITWNQAAAIVACLLSIFWLKSAR